MAKARSNRSQPAPDASTAPGPPTPQSAAQPAPIPRWVTITGLIAIPLLGPVLTAVQMATQPRPPEAPRLELTVAHAASMPWTMFGPDQEKHFRVEYHGNEIAKPFGSTFIVANTGTAPIRRAIVEGPLRLDFPGAKLVNAAQHGKTDPQLDVEVSPVGDSARVAFGLLNPGDGFGVDVLFEGQPPGELVASCRIEGMSSVRLIRGGPPYGPRHRGDLTETTHRYEGPSAWPAMASTAALAAVAVLRRRFSSRLAAASGRPRIFAAIFYFSLVWLLFVAAANWYGLLAGPSPPAVYSTADEF